jgi:tetratricopeptide (TPR) repeat protein
MPLLSRRKITASAVLAACAILSISAAAQNSDEAKSAQIQKDFSSCTAAKENTDVSIEACTRLLGELAQIWAAVLTRRGTAWGSKGELDRAVADLSEAIRVDPSFAYAYWTRANIRRDRNQCDQAIADYDQVVRLLPKRPEVYVMRGTCLMLNGDYNSASRDFDAAVRLDADNAGRIGTVALSMRGNADALKGDFDHALADFDQAIKRDGQSAGLYIGRAEMWKGKSNYERALADLDQAIKLDPDNAKGAGSLAWAIKGGLFLVQANFDSAVAAYNEAIRLDPERAAWYLNRGAAMAGKGQFDLAFSDYDRAIKLDPNNSDGTSALAWSMRGRLHLVKGEVDRSVTDFDEAIRLDPERAGFYIYRAAAWTAEGEYERAIREYDRTIALQPDELSAYGSRGITRFYLGDFPKAADDFVRLAQGPVDAYAMLWLYLSSARAGRPDAKEELIRRAQKLTQTDWPYPVVELFLERRTSEALTAIAGNPVQRCEAQFYVGEWYLLRQGREEAARTLRSAADDCPKNVTERQAAIEELKRLKPNGSNLR